MARREIENVPLSRFGVLVAQLESIAASAPQQSPDPILCFDLLSELVSAINEESQESILHWQRKCEDALFKLLVLGARCPVRHLASVAMARVIAKGDSISIYSRVSSLQGWLSDTKRGDALSYAGSAQCLGELYRLFGRRITSGLMETTSIAAKLMRFHEDFVRQEALLMLHNALEGSGGNGASAAYSEAFRIIMRVGLGDKSFIVRLASARCLKTFASIGGPGLGSNDLDSCASYCVKALEDPMPSVRDAFAEALGAILALGINPGMQMQSRGKGNPHVARKLEGGLQKHLVLPFMKASGSHLKNLRVGLSLSWVFLLQALRHKYLLPDGDLSNYALQVMDMLQGNSFVDAHATACVLYILRVGVADQMAEIAQRNLLVLLAKQLESDDFLPPKGVAVLRLLSYLLTTLGEVPVEFKEILDNTVVAALSHSSVHVRIEAALTLRGLAEVDPTCVGGLISFGVTTLLALRETLSVEKVSHLRVELDSFHGQAIVLAALISISPRLTLGYPARLPKSVLDLSKKIITEYSRNVMAATMQKEAGWVLLASLISSIPKEELEDQIFDILTLWAAPFGGNLEIQIKGSHNMSSEICVWSAAMEALTAFIRRFISSAISDANYGIFLQPVLVYLSGALSYICSLAEKQLHDLKPAIDLFTIRTLVAYQALPDPMAYRSDHSKIIQICTTPFRDPSRYEESSCLRMLLDKRDACLGPWVPGRDWFEDELRAFQGGSDGLLPCIWESQISSFPQPETISKALLNQMLMFFGIMFAAQDGSGKLTHLTMVDQCLKAGKKQSWHVASVTNVCVGLLSGLKASLALRQMLHVDVLSSMQTIFQGILAEGEICASQRRASAEGLGLLVRLGNDFLTARMIRSLLGELVTTMDSSYIGSIAFSLGCIHQSAGGIALSTFVPATVNSVSLLAKGSNTGLQSWSLHALRLTIEAAGLSYVSQVQATLSLAMEVLLSDENGWVELRQGVGRLVNAIIAVLGPELAPGSTFFSRCKSVVAEISSGQETSTLIECVRFTQQLVLFAPQAVSTHSHVQTLLPTLSSKQPSLRHLAVSTLHHLIEKDPVTIIDEKIEQSLFNMLDEETDSEIGNLVRSTIKRLLFISCPMCPSRWLEILRIMVLATSAVHTAENHNSSGRTSLNGTSEGIAPMYFGEDVEDMIASSNGRQVQDSITGISMVDSKRNKHLRYRTRLFAAECLSYIPAAVGTNPVHFDLTLARKLSATKHAGTGDWLVLSIQDFISLAYQISTGQFEGMQPIGVGLLITIMDKFGKVGDPDLPGHLLLEQYQAQLVSAVRTALSSSSGPLLLEAGLQLATKILTSSILSGDRVALQRLFTWISHPLNEFKDLYYPSFAEWVACKIKVRLLAAHASVKCYVYGVLREQKALLDDYRWLIPLFSNSANLLGKYWLLILRDYCYICFSLQSKGKYEPFLDGIQSLLVSSKVRPCLDEAWPVILQAIALDAAPMKSDTDVSSKVGFEDYSANDFISGHSMVQLELREFHFLWGLVLLVLFQGEKQVLHKHILPLPSHDESRLSENTSFKEPYLLPLESCEMALLVLQSLLTRNFFSLQFVTLDLCEELLQVLIYSEYMTASWNSFVVHLLLKIVQFCPDNFLDMENFTCLAIELCAKYLCKTFHSSDALLQTHPVCDDLLSSLLTLTEKILFGVNHEMQDRLFLAIISTGCGCFRAALTDLCLLSVMSFFQNIAKVLKNHIEGNEPDNGAITQGKRFLGVCVNAISNLSEDCMMRIHMEDKKTISFKLLAKKLAFCLEEAVYLARIAHDNQHFNQNGPDSHMFNFNIYMHCTRSIKKTLNDSDVQVQTIGLLVLKNIALKEVHESSRIKSHSFFMFIGGEMLGDIFFLVQNIVKKPLTAELVAIVDGCLRLLGLLHRISQKSECEKGFTSMLLETIFMIVTAPAEGLSKELNEIKGTAMALVSQLAQLPSAAAQVKDILLAMPVTFRLQLQDIIRVSVSQSQASVETKPNISIPATKLAVQLKPSSEPRTHASQSAPVQPNTDGFDEDDWDAFQSLPASVAVPPQATLAAANGSSVSDDEEDDFHDFSSALPTEFPEQAVEVQNVERDDKEEAISQGDDDRQGKNPHSQHYDKSSHHPDLDEKEAKGREFEGQDLHEVYDSLPFEDATDKLDDDHHVENKQCDFVEDSSIQPLGNANVTNDAIHEEAMRDGEGPNYHISSDSSPVMDPKEELSSGLDVENDRGTHPSVDEMNDALNEETTRDSEEHDFHKPSDSLPLEDPKEEYSSDHHVESNRGALLQVDELNDARHEELRDGGGHDLHKSSGSMPAENLKEELNS